jgi:hypothetical protein
VITSSTPSSDRPYIIQKIGSDTISRQIAQHPITPPIVLQVRIVPGVTPSPNIPSNAISNSTVSVSLIKSDGTAAQSGDLTGSTTLSWSANEAMFSRITIAVAGDYRLEFKALIASQLYTTTTELIHVVCKYFILFLLSPSIEYSNMNLSV